MVMERIKWDNSPKVGLPGLANKTTGCPVKFEF